MMIINSSVSVIIPFVNEWPQIAFTLRAISEELRDSIDYEIVVIDNYCNEVFSQGNLPDRGHSRWVHNGIKGKVSPIKPKDFDQYSFVDGHIESMAKQNPWMKYVRFDKKLSHWNAKNEGVKASKGKYLLFLDAHVIPSRGALKNALWSFDLMAREESFFNTLHLPLTYHILENKKLIYKLVFDAQKGIAHYSFTPMPIVDKKEQMIFEVPCMSTCGMFMTRNLFDRIQGWPEGLGIYGGGENYINFALAVIGSKKFIYPYASLHHHGEKRNYSSSWVDYHRNRMIATIIFGGEDFAKRYLIELGENETTRGMFDQARESSKQHKKNIDMQRKISIQDWAKDWEA